MKKNFLQLNIILISGVSFAQIGVNTASPKTTMDVSAKRDNSGIILDNTQSLGLQAPRITRAELTLNTATYNDDQKGALVYITDITGGNNTGQRANITTIGYYYFDGAIWQKLTGAGGTAAGPWNTQGGNTPATANIQNIYQSGSVAVKKQNAMAGVDLDVLGSIRGAGAGRLLTGGVTTPDVAGVNSIALGQQAEAEGEESMALGYGTKANSKQETVLGRFNAITNGNPTNATIATDPILQIGNGTGIGTNTKNAMTILKNGQIGVNIPGQNNSAKPDPSAILDVRSTDKGFLPPRVTLTNATMQLGTSPNATALWVYNTGGTGNLSAGYYYWDGASWASFEAANITIPTIDALQCNSAYLNPSTYVAGAPFSGNLRVTYSEGNGGKYASGTPFTVNGLTFQLRSSTLQLGGGELVFSVTGTPINADDMNIPLTSAAIPFLTASQSCTATVGNTSRADIKSVALMGYPTLTTDANQKRAYTLPLSSPDGQYSIRVIFDTTNGTTRAEPNVQLYNNTGSTVDLYWNYNTEYGAYIGGAATTTSVTSGVWGGMNDVSRIWYPQGTGARGPAYWGNAGIIDGANGGPEHRRYTWIDSNPSSKTVYTATIMAGAPTSATSQPNLTKIFIKIEQVKAQ